MARDDADRSKDNQDVFKSFGADPGIASSPFVATFVDVTGIVIYFTIASIWLL